MDDRGRGEGNKVGDLNEEQVENLNDAILSMLAISKCIYDNAIRVGFRESHAVALAIAYFSSSFKL